VNRDDFTSSFLIWMPFISFSCLVALARMSICSVLTSNGKSGYPCLVSGLRGKAFNLLPWSMIIPIGFYFHFYSYLLILLIYLFIHWDLGLNM
jgi:hypothetical protein